MVRTQIQLPDDLYARAKELSERRQISLAEMARRGIEYILSVYAPAGGAEDWLPPKPRSLGWKGLSDAEIKAQAQLTSPEHAFGRTRKK
jgi:hypothetical protein